MGIHEKMKERILLKEELEEAKKLSKSELEQCYAESTVESGRPIATLLFVFAAMGALVLMFGIMYAFEYPNSEWENYRALSKVTCEAVNEEYDDHVIMKDKVVVICEETIFERYT